MFLHNVLSTHKSTRRCNLKNITDIFTAVRTSTLAQYTRGSQIVGPPGGRCCPLGGSRRLHGGDILIGTKYGRKALCLVDVFHLSLTVSTGTGSEL
jgi:hypothetical protein